VSAASQSKKVTREKKEKIEAKNLWMHLVGCLYVERRSKIRIGGPSYTVGLSPLLVNDIETHILKNWVKRHENNGDRSFTVCGINSLSTPYRTK
jgi:hypothetical protein